MLLTVHRLPAERARLDEQLAAGANLVEVDVQLYRGLLRASHAVPVHPRAPYLRVDGWRVTGSRRPPGRDLDEVLASLPSGVPVSLDLKNERGDDALALARELVRRVTVPPGSWFAGKRLDALSVARAAGHATMLSVADRRALERIVADSAAPPVDALTVRHRLLTPAVVDRLARLALPVVAWVVDDPGRARELIAAGVQGITSDRPEVFRAVSGG